jgi:hypothetical protein
MPRFVGQPILAAVGFQPALFGGRKRSPAPKRPPERRLQAGLPAPQNRHDFGRTTLVPGLLIESAAQRQAVKALHFRPEIPATVRELDDPPRPAPTGPKCRYSSAAPTDSRG